MYRTYSNVCELVVGKLWATVCINRGLYTSYVPRFLTAGIKPGCTQHTHFFVRLLLPRQRLFPYPLSDSCTQYPHTLLLATTN